MSQIGRCLLESIQLGLHTGQGWARGGTWKSGACPQAGRAGEAELEFSAGARSANFHRSASGVRSFAHVPQEGVPSSQTFPLVFPNQGAQSSADSSACYLPEQAKSILNLPKWTGQQLWGKAQKLTWPRGDTVDPCRVKEAAQGQADDIESPYRAGERFHCYSWST